MEKMVKFGEVVGKDFNYNEDPLQTSHLVLALFKKLLPSMYHQLKKIRSCGH